ncbi:MAG: hypothetical protein Q9191_003031 [Dirinaria sp. TL-2023a]
MCWPSLDGDVVVEERRRRHKNEPRRKRLHFVKEHGSNDSDEWDLIEPQPRRHRQEVAERPHPHPQPQPWQYDPHWVPPPQHYQQHMQPHPVPIPVGHNSQPQMVYHGDQHRLEHQSHHDPDEIIRREEFVPRGNGHQPHIIERAPRSRVPSHVRARSRSRHRGHSHSRHGSLFSDDSYSDSRHGGRRRHHEPPYSDNDSFEDLRPGSRRRINRVTRFRRVQ